MDALNQFRQQFEVLRDALRAECDVLESQLNHKRQRLAALEVLLAGDDPPTKPHPTQSPEEPSKGTKTERAMEIVRNAKAKGVRPRDITKGLARQGISVGTGFASNLLFKTKGKETVEYNRRHYWKGFEPQEARKVLN